MVNAEYNGEPDLQRLFETLARAAGEQLGGCAEVVSIHRKAPQTSKESDAPP